RGSSTRRQLDRAGKNTRWCAVLSGNGRVVGLNARLGRPTLQRAYELVLLRVARLGTKRTDHRNYGSARILRRRSSVGRFHAHRGRRRCRILSKRPQRRRRLALSHRRKSELERARSPDPDRRGAKRCHIALEEDSFYCSVGKDESELAL